MTDSDEPATTDAELCMRLREQSKRGVKLHEVEMAFVESMFTRYPNWYKSRQVEIDKIVPFGANL